MAYAAASPAARLDSSSPGRGQPGRAKTPLGLSGRCPPPQKERVPGQEHTASCALWAVLALRPASIFTRARTHRGGRPAATPRGLASVRPSLRTLLLRLHRLEHLVGRPPQREVPHHRQARLQRHQVLRAGSARQPVNERASRAGSLAGQHQSTPPACRPPVAAVCALTSRDGSL